MKSAIAIIVLLGLLPVAILADDFHLEYYTDVDMDCDSSLHNFTSTSEIRRRYWMLPSNLLITVSDNDEHLQIEAANFSLTVKQIDDDDFGKYFCLLVREDFSVDRIAHGLNVDGAYFGDLLDKYLNNAMIGGIAAGSLFVVLAGSCIIWHLRYHKRDERNKAVDQLDKTINGYDLKAYDNVGVESDVEPGTKTGANGVTELDDKM